MRRLLVLFIVLVGLIPTIVLAQDVTPEPDLAGPARTDARYFLPFGPDGLKAALTVTDNVAGTCIIDSLALPDRADAWDCVGDGDQIYDPCFENPFTAEDEPSELVCVESPFTNEVILLSVADPLPRDKEAPPGQELFSAWDLPWGLELANGDRCVLLPSIDVVLAGEAVHYGCENGGSVLGEVDRGQPVWTVNYLAADAVGSSLVDVTVAWS